MVQLSHPYMTTGETIALTRWTFVGKIMSLLFNRLFRLVITFLPRSKCLLISWLQSPSAVISSCEMPGWMKHKLDSRLPGKNINNLKYADDTTLMAESEEELKNFLMKVKEDSKKAELKVKYSKNKNHGIWSHHFLTNRWGNNGNSDRLYFLGFQNHCRW